MTLKISTHSGDLIEGVLDCAHDFACRKTPRGYLTRIKSWKHETSGHDMGKAGIRRVAYAAIARYRAETKTRSL